MMKSIDDVFVYKFIIEFFLGTLSCRSYQAAYRVSRPIPAGARPILNRAAPEAGPPMET